MKVINVHKRIIDQPKEKVSKLLQTLASEDDKIWPNKKWPAIRFKEGLRVGAKGGHGIIRYDITQYNFEDSIYFKFTRPLGFNGYHNFKINQLEHHKTEVIHCIDMKTHGMSTFSWMFIIRWLHDALIEDALDKLENHFLVSKKHTEWSFWVRFWRYILK